VKTFAGHRRVRTGQGIPRDVTTRSVSPREDGDEVASAAVCRSHGGETVVTAAEEGLIRS
jgi:hypothetical protein